MRPSPERSFVVRLVAIGVALGVVGVSSTAEAQISLASSYPRRTGLGADRSASCTPNPTGCVASANCGINSATCFDGGSAWTFSFTFGNLGFENLMVFGTVGGSGSACAPLANRQAPTGETPLCHLVAVYGFGDVVGKDITIPDSAIVSAFEGVDVAGAVDTDAVCRGNGATDMDPTYSTLSFFLTSSSDPKTPALAGSDGKGDELTFQLYWDVIGPQPPTGFGAQPGDGEVQLTWAGSDTSGGIIVPDPCVQGYQVFDVPLPYSGPVPDVGTPDTAVAETSVDTGTAPDTAPDDTAPTETDVDADESGLDADDSGVDSDDDSGVATDDTGSATSATDSGTDETDAGPTCTGPTPFVAGEIPGLELAPYAASQAANGDTSTWVTGLTNYVNYELALGGTDTFGNVGPLTAPACAEPKGTVDFFGAYREAGGGAGGGYCAFGREPVELVGGSMAILALAGWIARRSRRRRWSESSDGG